MEDGTVLDISHPFCNISSSWNQDQIGVKLGIKYVI